MAEPSAGVFYVGESTILECAGGSTTILQVTWTKNGQPYNLTTPTTEHEQVHTRNIGFPVLEDIDSGVYICTVASQQYRRSVTTRPATLTVFSKCIEIAYNLLAIAMTVSTAPVSIMENPDNTTVNASTILTWSCLVEGSHDVRVNWWNDSSQVVEDSRVEIRTQQLNSTFTRSTLTIQGVDVTDTALYSCNTSNVVPINNSFTSTDASHDFTLFVQSECNGLCMASHFASASCAN